MGAPDKITFKLNLDLADIPREDRAQARQDVADFLKEQILTDISKGISSVSGKKWDALDPDYKKFKSAHHSRPVANLELTGALLDSLEVEQKKDSIEIGWFDPEQVPKADGHNNFSGDSRLPLRQSIPQEDQKFRPAIREQIAEILDGYRND